MERVSYWQKRDSDGACLIIQEHATVMERISYHSRTRSMTALVSAFDFCSNATFS
jgi:hypothetical protein